MIVNKYIDAVQSCEQNSHLLEQRSIYAKFLSNFRSIEQNQGEGKKRNSDKKTRQKIDGGYNKSFLL